MTRLTASVLARIRALPRDAWAKMDPRLRAALHWLDSHAETRGG